MQTINKELTIWKAQYRIWEFSYLQQMKNLILKSIEQEPTLVLHPDEIIRKKHRSSIVAINGSLVGNVSVYPTTINPLDSVVDCWNNKIKIWECGSIVVDLQKRFHGLGTKMVEESIKSFWAQYDAIISATVNPTFAHIAMSLWFEEILFPKNYYDEWLTHLSPNMDWGAFEFANRAKCLLRLTPKTQRYKNLIIDQILEYNLNYLNN